MTPRLYFPLSNKFTVSSEKVENVVKPPQTPTFKNNNSLSFTAYAAAVSESAPIKKEPAKFISSVGNGNPCQTGMTLESRYRKAAPANPSIPTNRTFIDHSLFSNILPKTASAAGPVHRRPSNTLHGREYFSFCSNQNPEKLLRPAKRF